MMRHLHLVHRFTETLPDQLEAGVLYVSTTYATAAHRCCCGCGSEVVTPFTPTDWKMTFDGETISLHPSVGNWNLACRSHYVIKRGHVIEAGPWDDEQIAAERRRDRVAKDAYYGKTAGPAAINPGRDAPPSAPKARGGIGAWLQGFASQLLGRR